jgi:hypothetical protein
MDRAIEQRIMRNVYWRILPFKRAWQSCRHRHPFIVGKIKDATDSFRGASTCSQLSRCLPQS